MSEKNIVIFYRGSACPDGFGAAYAAWKKFGDTAEYIPLSRGEDAPVEAAAGKEVYFLDFCYPKEIMDRFAAGAKTLTVIDHHAGMKEVIEHYPGHIFDNDRSGAGIAWDYFHPETPRPTLLNHVEDDDLFRFALPDTRPLITFLEIQPFDFLVWDELVTMLDDETEMKTILLRAAAYREYFEKLAEISIKRAKLISFEGHEVYFTGTQSLKSFKSYVGNMLVKKQGPFALVVSAHPKGYGVSIRGDGSVDVSKIAQKYGGNGHANSAGFHILADKPLPWTLVENEDSID